jgi:hypothetical protein
LPDRECGLIALESGRKIALRPQRAANPFVAEGKFALPVGIAGISGGEPLPDRERSLETIDRGREIALRLEQVADVNVGTGEMLCQPAFPGSVAARRSRIACAAL